MSPTVEYWITVTACLQTPGWLFADKTAPEHADYFCYTRVNIDIGRPQAATLGVQNAERILIILAKNNDYKTPLHCKI